MQGRSKRKSCLNNPYTSRSASTIYNSKILQTLPHSSLRVQQISPSWSKHKILAPALFLSKKLGKREEIPKKMRNLVGSFDCINKLKYALRQAFAQQKQLSTRVFSGSEAEPTTRKKKSVMKRNYLTTNYFGGGNSVISGLASIFHIPTKRWLLIVSKGDNCHHFDVFCPWKPAKHPLEPTRRALRNGLCRHHQG